MKKFPRCPERGTFFYLFELLDYAYKYNYNISDE